MPNEKDQPLFANIDHLQEIEEKPAILNYYELSRVAWSTPVAKGKETEFPGVEMINMACSQRSALALENIAQTTVALINDYVSVKQQLEKLRAEHNLLLSISHQKTLNKFNFLTNRKKPRK